VGFFNTSRGYDFVCHLSVWVSRIGASVNIYLISFILLSTNSEVRITDILSDTIIFHMKVKVLYPWETFKGMSYGDWSAVWTNWLLSEEVDTYNGQDILFLRGNIDYRPIGGIVGGVRHQDSDSFLNRTGDKGFKVLEGTSVLIPITVAYYIIGDYFNGNIIENEIKLRYALNSDFNLIRSIWAVIKKSNSKKWEKIVSNLASFKMESPLFQLRVPTNSILNQLQDEPLKPGTYYAVIGGYFLLLKSLPKSKYRISFGAEGPGEYSTRSIYDIEAYSATSTITKDISGRFRNFKTGLPNLGTK